MAILSKIRSKGIFLIVIIALALFAFIFSGVLTNSDSLNGKQNTVGSVNGTEITREDFGRKVEQQSRALGPNGSTLRAVNTVWDREVEAAVLEEQYEALGIQVSDERLQEILKQRLENNPQFQDEEGFFSPGKMQEYIASVENTEAYSAWVAFEQQAIEDEKKAIYTNLVKAGVGATLKDGEVAYKLDGNTVDIQYVQVPYTTIADDEVTVSKEDIAAYVKEHKDEFDTEATRSIRYVKFDEKATLEDENEVKAGLTRLITEDVNLDTGKVYGDQGLSEIPVDRIADFVNENSETTYSDRWISGADLKKVERDTLLSLPVGAVYGPYKINNVMYLDRVVAATTLPDSSSVRHILISTQGPEAMPKAAAKKLADSLEQVVRRTPSKFSDLAAQFSTDPGSKDKGGVYEFFPQGRMVAPFNDFSFEKEVGSVGTVETDYGYHVIEVLDQTAKKKALKVATIAKELVPSEKTVGEVYSTTQAFEIAAREGDYATVAKEKGYTALPVNSIQPLNELLPGVGAQRDVVQWAFEEDTKVGDVKRFQINDGYIVVQVTKRTKKGLASTEDASAMVTPIVRNKKKAALIKSRISSTDLNEVASSQGQAIKTATALNMANPTIAGAGKEPKVVGAAFGLKEGQTSKLIEGDRGVYLIKVTKLTDAPDLGNYASFATQQAVKARTAVNTQVVQALKKGADVEDNRATFY